MLVTMKEILEDAKEKNIAVGAFNVPNLESIQAVISAAEELNVPVIIQHAEVHENLITMQEIGANHAGLCKTRFCSCMCSSGSRCFL